MMCVCHYKYLHYISFIYHVSKNHIFIQEFLVILLKILPFKPPIRRAPQPEHSPGGRGCRMQDATFCISKKPTLKAAVPPNLLQGSCKAGAHFLGSERIFGSCQLQMVISGAKNGGLFCQRFVDCLVQSKTMQNSWRQSPNPCNPYKRHYVVAILRLTRCQIYKLRIWGFEIVSESTS